MKKHLFTTENIWAVLLALVLVALVIVSVSDAPLWIYQGF